MERILTITMILIGIIGIITTAIIGNYIACMWAVAYTISTISLIDK